MIALTSPYFWYTTRATGMVTLVLFTLVVTLGTLVANRVGGTFVGRFELNELHRSVSMVAVVFLAIHILTTVLDSFAPTGWLSIVIPFASQYRRSAVAVGAIAFDLTMAVWVSSLLKLRIRNHSWRFIHWFSWLSFAAALTHALLTGTDARHGAGLVVIVSCAVTGLLAALWRFVGRPQRAAGRTALSPLSRPPHGAPGERPGRGPTPRHGVTGGPRLENSVPRPPQRPGPDAPATGFAYRPVERSRRGRP